MSKKTTRVPSYLNTEWKKREYSKVLEYIHACIQDGYAFEYSGDFKNEIGQFLEPLLEDQINAIKAAAEIEREIFSRDARILQLETELAFRDSLTKIFAQVDKAIDAFHDNKEERELLAEFDKILAIEVTPENAAEHSRKLKELLKKSKTVFSPETRKTQLKRAMNDAVFGTPASLRDEMILPLRRMGQSREKREAKFQDWISRHYGL